MSDIEISLNEVDIIIVVPRISIYFNLILNDINIILMILNYGLS
jgi:hypothetical protein